jgi:ribosome-associated translation inhibitor RaiA
MEFPLARQECRSSNLNASHIAVAPELPLNLFIDLLAYHSRSTLMQIQLNSDHHITASPGLQDEVERILLQQLKYLAEDVTRIEVHLNDENSMKGGDSDKRCMLEARVTGLQPVVSEHRAPTVELALTGAAEQLTRALKNALEKLDSRRKGSSSIRGMEPPDGYLH